MESLLPPRTAWGTPGVPPPVPGTAISTVVLRRDSQHIRPRDRVPILLVPHRDPPLPPLPGPDIGGM